MCSLETKAQRLTSIASQYAFQIGHLLRKQNITSSVRLALPLRLSPVPLRFPPVRGFPAHAESRSYLSPASLAAAWWHRARLADAKTVIGKLQPKWDEWKLVGRLGTEVVMSNLGVSRGTFYDANLSVCYFRGWWRTSEPRKFLLQGLIESRKQANMYINVNFQSSQYSARVLRSGTEVRFLGRNAPCCHPEQIHDACSRIDRKFQLELRQCN